VLFICYGKHEYNVKTKGASWLTEAWYRNTHIVTVLHTIFPGDGFVDTEWMVFFVFLVEFDVLSTTLLLGGGAGVGAASEANPFMLYIVLHPFLHFGLKILFAIFTIFFANIMEPKFRGIGTKIIQVACIPYMFSFALNLFWLLYTVKLGLISRYWYADRFFIILMKLVHLVAYRYHKKVRWCHILVSVINRFPHLS